MAIRFNKLIRPDQAEVDGRYMAEQVVRNRAAHVKMVFMSHKTGDTVAEREAQYIKRKHRVMVYLAEWDDNVESDSNQLPDYIMKAIRKCDGFLVNVTAAIAVSMWIGYEIGGGACNAEISCQNQLQLDSKSSIGSQGFGTSA